MSQKFSIVIEVGKDGKPITTGYIKAEANKANEHFVRLRESGKEAYFFQHPVADRRSKSAEQVAATLGERDAEGHVVAPPEEKKAPIPNHKANEIPMPAPKKRKGNQVEGVSLNIDADGPQAIDM
jgi:hypothetical protein